MFRKWEVALKMEVLVFKKDSKQELKNYRPISLLPLPGKIFERLLYDSMFKFFTENNSISQNQSDFKQVILVLTSSCQLRIKYKNLR